MAIARWRLLPYDVGSSTHHFALSDALARHALEPTVWWHATDQPTLILGTGQRWDGINAETCAVQGVLVVRRQAGGTAVFAAAGVLGLDVALPANHPLALPDIVEAYHWLGDVWCDAMHALGVDARLVSVGEARAAARDDEEEVVRLACFGTLSPYEVVVGTRKLVGLAQVRRRGNVLLQSGIHRHFDAAGLARLLAPQNHEKATSALQRAAIGWEEAAGIPVTEADIMAAFAQALERGYRVKLVPGAWTPTERNQVWNSGPSS